MGKYMNIGKKVFGNGNDEYSSFYGKPHALLKVTYYEMPSGLWEVPGDRTRGVEFATFNTEQEALDYIAKSVGYKPWGKDSNGNGHRKIPGRTELGKFTDDDGIEKMVVYEEWHQKYPYPWLVKKVYGEPTAKGKKHSNYIEMRIKLHDDWTTDMTDTWADPGRLPKNIVTKLAEIFGLEE